MCGRYNIKTNPQQFLGLFGDLIFRDPLPEPRFNIAPTDPTPVITMEDGARVSSNKRWGLVPGWAKDLKFGYRTINARSETVDTKPAFRSSFKRRRCLVPASGYFEWKKLDSKNKQPFNILMRHQNLFAMAGLWESWTDSTNNSTVETYTVITTESNELTRDIHDRMPVILEPQVFDLWLDSEFQDTDHLKSLLVPFESNLMEMYPVNSAVGNVRNKGPECIARMDEE